MRKLGRFCGVAVLFLLLILALGGCGKTKATATDAFLLGNTVLFNGDHSYLYEGKRVGLLTNQTGVNAQGEKTIDVFHDDPDMNLAALFAPEHGIDGLATAGTLVESSVYPGYDIPVYSLFGETRRPTPEMLAEVDVLFVDLQDIGSRTYTYISTVQYALQACAEAGIPVVVLDRPNPVGGLIAEGPVMDPDYITFVGCDILPISHGMTMGELALYFNRTLNADLTVVPMQGYTRDMLWQDTGLSWMATSPNIPDITAAFCYMATGMGEGTGIRQKNAFQWVGGEGVDSAAFADALNEQKLPGIVFHAEDRDGEGGVSLEITDYRSFNPALTGLAVLAEAERLLHFPVPRTGEGDADRVMFEKLVGGTALSDWLEQGLTVWQMREAYGEELAVFKEAREEYLLYPYGQ